MILHLPPGSKFHSERVSYPPQPHPEAKLTEYTHIRGSALKVLKQKRWERLNKLLISMSFSV